MAASAAKTSGKPRQVKHEPPYRVDDYRIEESIGFLIGAVKQRLMTALDAEMEPFGISAAQWGILARIANGMNTTAAGMCRCSGYDTGSMTRMLDRLEEKGLVRRSRSAEDRRVVLLDLTATGRALYPKLLATAVKVLNKALDGFSPEEIQSFKGFLRRML